MLTYVQHVGMFWNCHPPAKKNITKRNEPNFFEPNRTEPNFFCYVLSEIEISKLRSMLFTQWTFHLYPNMFACVYACWQTKYVSENFDSKNLTNLSNICADWREKNLIKSIGHDDDNDDDLNVCDVCVCLSVSVGIRNDKNP